MKERIYTKKSEQVKRSILRQNMTKAEVLLWLELKNKKLGVRFLRQFSIRKYVLDFYSPGIKLAIEVDGATHSSPEEKEYDDRRQRIIEENKIIFLRFSNSEIYEDLYNVLVKIKTKIADITDNQ